MPCHHEGENLEFTRMEREFKELEDIAAPAVRQAAKNLSVDLKEISPFLLRNYFQVAEADAVFAIADFDPVRTGVSIEGGTGYACQMYHDMGKKNLFLWEMSSRTWCRLLGDHGAWVEEEPKISDYDSIACIGSRKFSEYIDFI